MHTVKPVTDVKLTASHDYASGGTYTDTVTELKYNGGTTVYVTVTMQPFLQYWSCPPAAVIRKWVDELLKGHDLKRDGARLEITGGSMSNWKFHYYVKAL